MSAPEIEIQLSGYTLADIVKCLERELKLRKRIYPGRVEHHRMTKAFADRELAIMEQVLADYRAALAEEDLFPQGG